MVKILLGMVIMYFIINCIIVLLLVYTQWKSRKTWRLERLIITFFIGTILIIAEIFHDEF